MLQRNYTRIQQQFKESTGYLRTTDLLENGVTTLQLRQLVDAGSVEKISHGIYWWLDDGRPKPKLYKYLETQMADSKSVICMTSALYLDGLLKKEPQVVSIATSRADRSKLHMNFPISRHYYAERSINDYVSTLETPEGPIHYYSVDRSVVDCIRLRNELEDGLLEKIMKRYKNWKKKDLKVYMSYAEDMGMQRVAEKYLS